MFGPDPYKKGQIIEVTINEGRIFERCFSAAICDEREATRASACILELPHLELHPGMFVSNPRRRYCVVVDVIPPLPIATIGEGPRITVFLIPELPSVPLELVSLAHDMHRLLPLERSSTNGVGCDTVNAIRHIPEHVLCIPIRIYPQQVKRILKGTHVTPDSLGKLESHITSLGWFPVIKYAYDENIDDSICGGITDIRFFDMDLGRVFSLSELVY